MQQLIDDLLTFTRVVGTGQAFEPVDLNLLLAEVQTEFQETLDELGATVSIGLLPTVKGITFQLRQLFVNLLSNSVKFRETRRPLSISVTASGVRVPEWRDVYGSERFDRIEVRDNGIGFAADQADKIFGIFERLHARDEYPGTGIGLAICRRIMENNNGFIRAEGIPGHGAGFEIFFRAG
jgi:signal transduction histidine kinase